jgi:hypothetical protein
VDNAAQAGDDGAGLVALHARMAQKGVEGGKATTGIEPV